MVSCPLRTWSDRADLGVVWQLLSVNFGPMSKTERENDTYARRTEKGDLEDQSTGEVHSKITRSDTIFYDVVRADVES